MEYHVPVMVAEVVRWLIKEGAGIYLDATAGGGGHCRAILAALPGNGRLIAVDRDPEAVRATARNLAEFGDRVSVLQGSFVQLKGLMDRQRVEGVNGVLFDLGVSSRQIDEPERGFSYREEGPLDMRMDPEKGMKASEWIDRASEGELVQVIRQYGEERHARRIGRAICRLRMERPLETTDDLRQAVESTHPQMPNKTLARVFQAFRIAVNDELGQLDRGLEEAIDLLLPGGRLVTMAYHSLEDRLIKRKMAALIRGCICPPEIPVCVCGREPTFKKVNRRPSRAGADEVQRNRRARSAILRAYEKI